MGERHRDFILCVFLLLSQALILPTASPANLPGIVTGFIGSASFIPVATPAQISTPCKHTIAFCYQPKALDISNLMPQLTPPPSDTMLPTVVTVERTVGDGGQPKSTQLLKVWRESAVRLRATVSNLT